MTTDNRPSQTGSTTTSQNGAATGRSPEFNDGLTVQDTTTSAMPRENASYGTTRDLGDNHDGMGRDRTDAVTSDETGTLISADKVQGTAVYDASGERLGTIDSIMLNKNSGKVAYAVMSFGGFLGIGERYHPLPWNVLTYDESKGGYNVSQSADQLRGGPSYSRDEVSDFDYRSRGREIDDYYGVSTGRGATGLDTGASGTATSGAGSTGMASTSMGANRNM